MKIISMYSYCAVAVSIMEMMQNLQVSTSQQIVSVMPDENELHEGTWLTWPHPYQYGRIYRSRIEKSWIAMTKALAPGEKVHIVAYNRNERNRITRKLRNAKVNLKKVTFLIRRTNDVWIRDNGPIFVRNKSTGKLEILDWGFNGWGYDTPYKLDNTIPVGAANQLKMKRVNLNDVVLEGGAVEIDGRGTLLATRSAVLKNKRNPGMTEAEMESYMRKYMGITNVIWLEGGPGGKEDITDTHIDGLARFGDPNTIVTMNRKQLKYYGLSNNDVNVLYNAKNASGTAYKFLILPLTKYNVKTAYKKNLFFKGSYINFYVGNKVVLMPSYGDPNDEVARSKLQNFYGSKRKVVMIDVRNLYKNGGMVHCVTQQQPVA